MSAFATTTATITTAVCSSFFSAMENDDLNSIMLTTALLRTLHDEAYGEESREEVVTIIAKVLVQIGIELGDLAAAQADGLLETTFAPRTLDKINASVANLA